jgi:hypothetical protein
MQLMNNRRYAGAHRRLLSGPGFNWRLIAGNALNTHEFVVSPARLSCRRDTYVAAHQLLDTGHGFLRSKTKCCHPALFPTKQEHV